jgi:hypothetical protein
MDINRMKLLVVDYGSQLKFAERMAESFDTVFYFNPNVWDGFQTVRDMEVGQGVKGIIKIKEWTSVVDIINCAAFTDCYEPEFQKYLRDLGIPVFGSGFSAELETDRGYLKDVIKQIGLPIGKFEIAKGIDYLEYLLKEKENVFIKSNHRGDHETEKWKNYKLSKGSLRRMRKEMGIFGLNETYIVEEKLDSIGEIGIDTFCVDGNYPQNVLAGIEVKDAGYIGCFMSYYDLPKQLKKVSDAFAPIFRDLGYRGSHSNEVIIGKDLEGYVIDLTQRMPQPPNDAILNAVSNYAECVSLVANGIVPIVRNDYKYVCQFILKSDIAKIDDTPIIVPDQYKKFVSVKNLYVDNEGTWYYTKRGMAMCEIGSVSAYGDTLKQAIEMAKEISDSIEAEDAHVELSSIDSGLDSIKKLNKAGIKFLL